MTEGEMDVAIGRLVGISGHRSRAWTVLTCAVCLIVGLLMLAAITVLQLVVGPDQLHSWVVEALT